MKFEKEKNRLLEIIKGLRTKRRGEKDSSEIIRELSGYENREDTNRRGTIVSKKKNVS